MRSAAVVTAVALAATLSLTAAASPAARQFPRFTTANCARADFSSRGTPVRAELCRATRDVSAGRAVVVLHGCGGFSTLDHRLTAELPGNGISTLYIDYFAPTPPTGNKGFCGGAGGLSFDRAQLFSRWVQVVDDAGRALARTSGINPRRVGLVGWSLGGGLAVDTAASASRAKRVFHALAAFSTGGYGRTMQEVASLPPTLLLSAGTTDAIPLSSTLELYRAAHAAGVRVSLFVFPNGSHSWPRNQGTIGIARTAHFLLANL